MDDFRSRQGRTQSQDQHIGDEPAGRSNNSLCPSSPRVRGALHLTRRGFLAAAGAAGALTLAGCGGKGSSSNGFDKSVLFRLSTRGQRSSQAAKANAANKRFATRRDALLGRAHPGDHARVVALDTTPALWDELFQDGARRVVDLRQLDPVPAGVV